MKIIESIELPSMNVYSVDFERDGHFGFSNKYGIAAERIEITDSGNFYDVIGRKKECGDYIEYLICRISVSFPMIITYKDNEL